MPNGSHPFAQKTKGHKKLILALLKMRLPYHVIMDMSEEDAGQYIDAFMEIMGRDKTKTYQVKRNRK